MASRIQSSWKLKLGLLVLVGASIYWGQTRRDLHHLQSTATRRGDLAQVLREEARTRFRVTYQVSLPFSGRLLRHELEEGDLVELDQVLARLQEDSPRARVESHQALLEAARKEAALAADLQEEDAGIAQAQASLVAAKAVVKARTEEIRVQRASLDLAESEWTRVQELSRRGAATGSQLDQVRSEVQRARAAWSASGSQLEATRAQVEQAQASLRRTQAMKGDQGARLLVLQARTRSLEAQQAPLLDELGRIEIRAPVKGVILAVHQRSEAVLPAGAPLFEIGVPESLEVEADILSEDATGLKEDGLYSAFGRALGDREWPMTLREVSPRAFTKRSSLGVEEQRVHAWFRMQDRPEKLGHGYRIHLRAALEVARQAILAPRRALVRQGDNWVVFRLVENQARSTPVTPGPGDESWVVIREGLEEGVSVLLDTPESLRDGDPVAASPAQDLAPPAPIPGSAPGGSRKPDS